MWYNPLCGGDLILATIQQKIEAACAYAGVTKKDIADRMGVTPSAFNQRLKTGKFSDADFKLISNVIGAEYVSFFRFPDGREI